MITEEKMKLFKDQAYRAFVMPSERAVVVAALIQAEATQELARSIDSLNSTVLHAASAMVQR